jgi:hypothetical protein
MWVKSKNDLKLLRLFYHRTVSETEPQPAAGGGAKVPYTVYLPYLQVTYRTELQLACVATGTADSKLKRPQSSVHTAPRTGPDTRDPAVSK